MKNILVAAVAILSATGAHAADIEARSYTKAPPMATVSSWTGFYAGVNVGYGFNDPVATFTNNDGVTNALLNFATVNPKPVSYDVKGVLGGAQVGYNWQVSPSWLIGLEADFQGSDIKGGGASQFVVTGGVAHPSQITAEQKVEWFGTVRARAGWLATDKLLVFGTGGLAYASVRENSTISNTDGGGLIAIGFGLSADCTGAAFAPCFSGATTKILTGYAAGGGFEYAAWRNVSFKAEYLYVNLGSSSTTSVALKTLGANGPASYSTHFSDLDFHVVRVGANYHF
jgi:outer membrane immunogenic protein